MLNLYAGYLTYHPTGAKADPGKFLATINAPETASTAIAVHKNHLERHISGFSCIYLTDSTTKYSAAAGKKNNIKGFIRKAKSRSPLSSAHTIR